MSLQAYHKQQETDQINIVNIIWLFFSSGQKYFSFSISLSLYSILCVTLWEHSGNIVVTLLLSDQDVKCKNFDALYKIRKYLYMFCLCLCLYMSALSTVISTVVCTSFSTVVSTVFFTVFSTVKE